MSGSRIAQRIGPAPAPVRESWLKRLWDSLGFWRGVGAVAAAAAAALAVHVALQPPGVGPELITTLDQRLTGIEAELAAINTTTREVGALDERLARIENATLALGQTPREIAALAAAAGRHRKPAQCDHLAPSHVAVLIDKYQRPMMTADLDVSEGWLALRLNIKPPRDFTNKILEVWMMSIRRHSPFAGPVSQREERHDDGSGPVARHRRSAGQGGARGQPRAIRRLDNGGAVGSGAVLGRGHARRSLIGLSQQLRPRLADLAEVTAGGELLP